MAGSPGWGVEMIKKGLNNLERIIVSSVINHIKKFREAGVHIKAMLRDKGKSKIKINKPTRHKI